MVVRILELIEIEEYHAAGLSDTLVSLSDVKVRLLMARPDTDTPAAVGADPGD
ncbi:MAG: hypothetical protein KF855_10330 [Acidobacteria bacterium]|nr:hypothetical protein [Acidobacteriota bacterium]